MNYFRYSHSHKALLPVLWNFLGYLETPGAHAIRIQQPEKDLEKVKRKNVCLARRLYKYKLFPRESPKKLKKHMKSLSLVKLFRTRKQEGKAFCVEKDFLHVSASEFISNAFDEHEKRPNYTDRGASFVETGFVWLQ